LDKVPPTEQDRARAAEDRLGELDKLIDDLDTQIADGQVELRRVAVHAPKDHIRAQEQALAALRVRRREAVNERDLVRRAPLDTAGPHDHLRHRALPDTATPTNALLRFWSGASLSILLLLLGMALLLDLAGVPWILIGTVAIVMGIEALLRGRLGLFLLGAAILVALGALIWLFFTHLRVAFGVLALIAAIAIGVANLRNTFNQR
jgi:membrane-bound ClpP family serine protease